MAEKIVKVGFDLDGVILYNPARIFRPIIAILKKYLLKRDAQKFYYPENKIEQLVWYLLHKSSLWPAPGIDKLIELIKKNKIQVYIVSGRYESLKSDFNNWINKIDPEHIFNGYFFNDKNNQPHLYKEKMIKKLGLDIFVEDNWDIVNHLITNHQSPITKIFWIYNILDKNISYPFKFPSLKAVINTLSKK